MVDATHEPAGGRSPQRQPRRVGVDAAVIDKRRGNHHAEAWTNAVSGTTRGRRLRLTGLTWTRARIS
jgi:hypothetical protein